jgi:hypothetical protein
MRRLRVAVTPTFARAILIPRLRQFTEANPEIDLTLQVSIPLLDVVAEDADLMIRFGGGRYADVEHVGLMCDAASMGIALGPLRLGAYWLDKGALGACSPKRYPARMRTTCAGAPAP